MVRIQFTLSKKTDVDLISFFTQQNEKAAALVVAALFSYIQGVEINPQLLPVTVTEQTKRMNVNITIKKSNRKQVDVQLLKNFINSIPSGMKSIFIKGILRYTYGSVIYQTETTVPRQSVPSVYTIPEVPSKTDSCNSEQESAGAAFTESKPDDDIFGLFESLLE